MDDELRARVAGMSDEELKALGADLGLDLTLGAEALPPEADATPQPVDEPVEIPDLMRASDLEETPPEPAELGLEPGRRYQGHPIITLPPDQVPSQHRYLFDRDPVQAFYIASPEGTIGLVPWLGSTIIWPWEKAWEQDLYHEKQTPERQAIMAAFVKAKKQKT